MSGDELKVINFLKLNNYTDEENAAQIGFIIGCLSDSVTDPRRNNGILAEHTYQILKKLERDGIVKNIMPEQLGKAASRWILIDG